MQKSPGDA